MRFKGVLCARATLVASFFALSAGAAFAVDADKFRVETTQDFVALCSAEPGSDNYVAAIHFCHGFVSGAYRYYQSASAGAPSTRYVCPPEPTPSRNDVIAGFVAWARSDPGVLNAPAVDSFFRYLGSKYPCKR